MPPGTRRTAARLALSAFRHVESPPTAPQPTPAAPGGDLARKWLARLAELEDRLSDDHIAEIPIWDWIPYSDGVSEEHLRKNRDALLQAINQARPFYRRLIQGSD